jgi:hypothetical protein
MPFRLIKGTFHVRNYSPDGDSIRFRPDNPDLVRTLNGGDKVRFNARGHVQLRIEAIDALETHYNPQSGGGTLHQPLGLANQALDHLLAFVGITDVEWDSTHRTVLDARDNVPGYILSRSWKSTAGPLPSCLREKTGPTTAGTYAWRWTACGKATTTRRWPAASPTHVLHRPVLGLAGSTDGRRTGGPRRRPAHPQRRPHHGWR